MINIACITSVSKLVESNELLSKDLLNFIESYKVRHFSIEWKNIYF